MGFSHAVHGEAIFAYVVLKEVGHATEEQIINELKLNVKNKIAGYAVPHDILVNTFFFQSYESI